MQGRELRLSVRPAGRFEVSSECQSSWLRTQRRAVNGEGVSGGLRAGGQARRGAGRRGAGRSTTTTASCESSAPGAVVGHRSWIAAGRGSRHRKGSRNAHSVRRSRAKREHRDGDCSSSDLLDGTNADGALGRNRTADAALTPRGSARRREGALALPGTGPRVRAARQAARGPAPVAEHSERHAAIAAGARSAGDDVPAVVRSRPRRGSRRRARRGGADRSASQRKAPAPRPRCSTGLAPASATRLRP